MEVEKDFSALAGVASVVAGAVVSRTLPAVYPAGGLAAEVEVWAEGEEDTAAAAARVRYPVRFSREAAAAPLLRALTRS